MVHFGRVMLMLVFTLVSFAQEETAEEKKARILLGDLKEARRFLYDKEYETALEKFELILKQYPNNIEALTGKMNVLGFQKKFRDVMTLSQSHKTAHKTETQATMIVAANSLTWVRKLPEARATLVRAIAMKPEEAYYAHYMLAQLDRAEDKTEAAIKNLEKAIKLNEDYPESYYSLGDIYSVKGNTSKVLQYWTAYLERVPHTGARYKRVNETLQRLGGG